ncbi:MAG TPA: hypothetical protein VFI28_05100 [Candidatus Limnocylindrales bacterium]|nr:hypothetical protein [Candidatus Limnocylindrales bacterium]
MPEQDANRAARARTKPAPREQPTEADEDAAHLSEAARGVVRQSADPRLDAHLARMLSPDETATPTHAPTVTRPTEAGRDELVRLTAELADARAAAEAAGRRVVSLTLLLGVALLAIVILLVVALR